MIKVGILTSSIHGVANIQIEELLVSDKFKIEYVIAGQGQVPNKWRFYRRKIKKAFKIGPLGVLIGFRLRNWFISDEIRNLSLPKICKKNDIPFFSVPYINSKQTKDIIEANVAEIGVSLGNGYISKSVFSKFERGMINIHHEILPDYQNASSVIWQIFNESKNSGYTIHLINDKIDAGDILYKEDVPILFCDNIRDTVNKTYIKLIKLSTKGLIQVLENYSIYKLQSKKQFDGNSYTTPNVFQFIKMCKNHKKLKNT